MSISTDGFGSSGNFLTYRRYRPVPSQTLMFHLECRRCGYEPDAVVAPLGRCPRCNERVWERFARPGSILEAAARFDNDHTSDGTDGVTRYSACKGGR